MGWTVNAFNADGSPINCPGCGQSGHVRWEQCECLLGPADGEWCMCCGGSGGWFQCAKCGCQDGIEPHGSASPMGPMTMEEMEDFPL